MTLWGHTSAGPTLKQKVLMGPACRRPKSKPSNRKEEAEKGILPDHSVEKFLKSTIQTVLFSKEKEAIRVLLKDYLLLCCY